MAPLVSIIVNCYNQGCYLDRSVKSVLSQTLTDLECIIIDDGSTDNTRQISESLITLDARVKYYFQENAGLASARNFGVSKAEGDWVQCLDADDWIHENKTRFQLEHLTGYQDQEVVFYSDYDRVLIDSSERIIDHQPNIIGALTNEELIERLLTPDFLSSSPHPALQQATLMRKSIFLKHPLQEGLKAMVDRYFALEIAEDEDITFVYTPLVGAFYTKHQSNMTNDWNHLVNSYAVFYERVAKQHPKLMQFCQKNLLFFVSEAIKEKNQTQFEQFAKFVQFPIYLADGKIKVWGRSSLNLAFIIRRLIPTTLLYEKGSLTQKILNLLSKPLTRWMPSKSG